MAIRKFRADRLFTGSRMLGNDHALVAEDSGRVVDIVPTHQAGETEYFEGILCPGFINCHCHLELSHMHGKVPTGTGLIGFISEVLQHRFFPQDQIEEAIKLADEEMFANGIVAVGDICNTADTISQKTKSRLYYHNFIELTGFDTNLLESRYQKGRDIYNLFQEKLSHNSMVPHAPYSVSRELMSRIISLDNNRILSIHNQETPEENSLFQDGSGTFPELFRKMKQDISGFRPSGTSSLQDYIRIPGRDQQIILVHNLFTSELDIQQLKTDPPSASLYWCICAGANLYISGGLPDLDLLINSGYPIVLGTDSLASNQQLDILAEMRIVLKEFPTVSTEQILGWATLNGARALQIEGLLGSFEVGKTPGINILDSGLKSVSRIL